MCSVGDVPYWHKANALIRAQFKSQKRRSPCLAFQKRTKGKVQLMWGFGWKDLFTLYAPPPPLYHTRRHVKPEPMERLPLGLVLWLSAVSFLFAPLFNRLITACFMAPALRRVLVRVGVKSAQGRLHWAPLKSPATAFSQGPSAWSMELLQLAGDQWRLQPPLSPATWGERCVLLHPRVQCTSYFFFYLSCVCSSGLWEMTLAHLLASVKVRSSPTFIYLLLNIYWSSWYVFNLQSSF